MATKTAVSWCREASQTDDDDDDANVEVDALVDIRRADCAHMVDTRSHRVSFDKSVKSFLQRKDISYVII